jgi:two-component system chemotaxis response regulator CheB
MMDDRIILVGASAGGVEAVSTIVRGLRPDLPAAVCVVMHFPDTATSLLPGILNRAGRLPCAHAAEAEPIRPGRIYVALPGHHLTVSDAHLHVYTGPKENGHRPAIDPLFRSAARAYGPNAIGVILSGNLDDGTAGLGWIKKCGGWTVVQDPDDAEFPGMPTSAVRYVEPDYIVPLDRIAALLQALVAAAPRDPGDCVSETLERSPSADSPARQNPEGAPSGFTCPECHGALWETHESGHLYFRCRIGHAFSSETLMVQDGQALEAALWTAVRSLEEYGALAQRLSASARKLGHDRSASAHAERALDAEHQAAIIRRTVDRLARQSDTPAE